MIWDQSNAFVTYLLVGRQDARYRKHVGRYWTDYDLMTGDYLYVVVTALLPERRDEEDQEEILATENAVTKELLSKFGLTMIVNANLGVWLRKPIFVINWTDEKNCHRKAGWLRFPDY